MELSAVVDAGHKDSEHFHSFEGSQFKAEAGMRPSEFLSKAHRLQKQSASGSSTGKERDVLDETQKYITQGQQFQEYYDQNPSDDHDIAYLHRQGKLHTSCNALISAIAKAEQSVKGAIENKDLNTQQDCFMEAEASIKYGVKHQLTSFEDNLKKASIPISSSPKSALNKMRKTLSDVHGFFKKTFRPKKYYKDKAQTLKDAFIKAREGENENQVKEDTPSSTMPH